MRDLAAPRPDARHAIGIDVGGTKVAGGVVDLSTGRIAHRRRLTSEGDGAALLARVVALARELRDAAGVPLAGLGLGVPELVDPDAQRVFSAYRIPWEGLDLRGALAAVLPARIEADVRAAALAEARFGAGRGMRDFLFVTVGTGVSAVSVRGGIPYAGARGAALVIANGPVRHRCPACGTEAVEVLEDVASGPALAAAAGAATAEAALLAATAGEPRARAAVERAGTALGRTLALLAGALDPEAIVVGGGLGSAPGPYRDALARAVAAGLWDGDARRLPVVGAGLGPDAGLIGAALVGAAGFNEADRHGARPDTRGERE